jgi:hypothetical protein
MTGEMFFAPCLKDLKEKKDRRAGDEPALSGNPDVGFMS